MKWNGIVSQRPHRTIAPPFARANANHAKSTLLAGKAVPDVAHGLDRRVLSELLANAAHTHVDDVRPGVEVVTPHLGQQPLAAHYFPAMLRELEQQPELPLGQIGHDGAESGSPP